MLVKDLRTKKDDELMQLVEDLKAELFMLRFKNKTGQLDKPHKIPGIKKDISKVLTILNARKLNIEKQNNSVKVVKVLSKTDKMYNKDEKINKSEQTSQVIKKDWKVIKDGKK